MKKLSALSLALVLILTLAACGGGGGDTPSGDPSPQTESPPPAGLFDEENEKPESDEGGAGSALSSLIDWMRDGTFRYDYKQISEGGGVTTETTGSVAMDGGKMCVVSENIADGLTTKSRLIFTDGNYYIVDDVSKIVITMQANVSELTGGMITDYSGIVKTGEGTGEVDGKTLPYEEYESEGILVKYYLENGQVYAFESEYDGYKSVTIITNPSNTVPLGVFDLPDGYTYY